jgi:hypothetical protein
MSDDLDYWSDALGEALSEVDAFGALTTEQRRIAAKVLSGAHECYGMAFYSPPPSEFEQSEVKRLERLLANERSLVFCRVCQGTGREEHMSGPWHVNTSCYKCNGQGKHKP